MITDKGPHCSTARYFDPSRQVSIVSSAHPDQRRVIKAVPQITAGRGFNYRLLASPGEMKISRLPFVDIGHGGGRSETSRSPVSAVTKTASYFRECCVSLRSITFFFRLCYYFKRTGHKGSCGSVVVKAICYKPEGRGLDSR
jgi:hypothetical protein